MGFRLKMVIHWSDRNSKDKDFPSRGRDGLRDGAICVSRRDPGSRRRVRGCWRRRPRCFLSIDPCRHHGSCCCRALVHRSAAALLQGVVRGATTYRDELRSVVSAHVLPCFEREASDAMDVRCWAAIDAIRRSRKRRETTLPKPVSANTFSHRSGWVALCDLASLSTVKRITRTRRAGGGTSDKLSKCLWIRRGLLRAPRPPPAP